MKHASQHRPPVGSSPKSTFGVLAAVLALLLAACSGQLVGGTTTETVSTTETTTTTTEPPTTTAPVATTTWTTEPRETVTYCENPDGLVVAYPSSWSTNPRCTQFHPEPFEPSPGEERVAAITVHIDPVPFDEAVTSDAYQLADRAATVVDGLQAERLEYRITEETLLPEGTPVTLYAVDLGVDSAQEQQTLWLDTVGISNIDYQEAQAVLDQMARSLQVAKEGAKTGHDVIARYGGASGFRVEATADTSEACLRIPPQGDAVCTHLPEPRQVVPLELIDLQPVLVGVAGSKIFRIDAHLETGEVSSFLPVPIGDDGVQGFAFTFSPEEVTELVLFDDSGAEFGRVSRSGETGE